MEFIEYASVPFAGVWLGVWLTLAVVLLVSSIVVASLKAEPEHVAWGLIGSFFLAVIGTAAASAGVSHAEDELRIEALTEAEYSNATELETSGGFYLYTAKNADGDFVTFVLIDASEDSDTIKYQVVPVPESTDETKP